MTHVDTASWSGTQQLLLNTDTHRPNDVFQMTITLVTILKLDTQFTNVRARQNVRYPLNNERSGLHLVRHRATFNVVKTSHHFTVHQQIWSDFNIHQLSNLIILKCDEDIAIIFENAMQVKYKFSFYQDLSKHFNSCFSLSTDNKWKLQFYYFSHYFIISQSTCINIVKCNLCLLSEKAQVIARTNCLCILFLSLCGVFPYCLIIINH